MNILFFLKPKGELAYLYDDSTLRQGLEKLERSGFTAIPLINRNGEYIGTITEGDMLWTLKNKFSLDLRTAEDVSIQTVRRRAKFEPISIDSNIDYGILLSGVYSQERKVKTACNVQGFIL